MFYFFVVGTVFLFSILFWDKYYLNLKLDPAVTMTEVVIVHKLQDLLLWSFTGVQCQGHAFQLQARVT